MSTTVTPEAIKLLEGLDLALLDAQISVLHDIEADLCKDHDKRKYKPEWLSQLSGLLNFLSPLHSSLARRPPALSDVIGAARSGLLADGLDVTSVDGDRKTGEIYVQARYPDLAGEKAAFLLRVSVVDPVVAPEPK